MVIDHFIWISALRAGAETAWWWLSSCTELAVAQAHTPGLGSLVHTHLLSSSPADATILRIKDTKDYEEQVLGSDFI